MKILGGEFIAHPNEAELFNEMYAQIDQGVIKIESSLNVLDDLSRD
jgi:hypothetical protein